MQGKYEIHITLNEATDLPGWKSSRILDKDGTHFLTSYATTEELARCRVGVALTMLNEVSVTRVKIEHIVYDWRPGDNE